MLLILFTQGVQGGEIEIIKIIISTSPALLMATNKRGQYPKDLVKDNNSHSIILKLLQND